MGRRIKDPEYQDLAIIFELIRDSAIHIAKQFGRIAKREKEASQT